MYLILGAIIIILLYFFIDLFLEKISVINQLGGLSNSWNIGVKWFIFLLFFNVFIVIFIPLYFYYKVNFVEGEPGKEGPTGDKGTSSNIVDTCYYCS